MISFKATEISILLRFLLQLWVKLKHFAKIEKPGGVMQSFLLRDSADRTQTTLHKFLLTYFMLWKLKFFGNCKNLFHSIFFRFLVNFYTRRGRINCWRWKMFTALCWTGYVLMNGLKRRWLIGITTPLGRIGGFLRCTTVGRTSLNEWPQVSNVINWNKKKE